MSASQYAMDNGGDETLTKDELAKIIQECAKRSLCRAEILDEMCSKVFGTVGVRDLLARQRRTRTMNTSEGTPLKKPSTVKEETLIGTREGIVKRYNSEKGFGFIEVYLTDEEGENDGIEEDAFVHYSEIQMTGYKALHPDQEVKFDLYSTIRETEDGDVPGFVAKKVATL